jgi:hypothetical protein
VWLEDWSYVMDEMLAGGDVSRFQGRVRLFRIILNHLCACGLLSKGFVRAANKVK